MNLTLAKQDRIITTIACAMHNLDGLVVDENDLTGLAKPLYFEMVGHDGVGADGTPHSPIIRVSNDSEEVVRFVLH